MRWRRKEGFTLVEMMMALLIAAIIFSAMGMVMSRTFSLWADSMARWKLAQHARIARERILRGGFADPESGLLSATNISIVGSSYALNIAYGTSSNFYGICAYTNRTHPTLYLFDQKTIDPWWSGDGYDGWSWGVRSGRNLPTPDVEVPYMTAVFTNQMLTLNYTLEYSAAGKTFEQPQTIRAYLINVED